MSQYLNPEGVAWVNNLVELHSSLPVIHHDDDDDEDAALSPHDGGELHHSTNEEYANVVRLDI